ncbi:MAG: restriction endonuclease subunit S [Acidimicrobiaceae bacterium]|nr:restriction endonuclease subunit S [Acidimicrobiaceae bacterium]MYH78632.1 restriction endonuclease subunit S [Acidimicrobiaceae bacterium]
MPDIPMREAIKFAIGGGWGDEAPSADTIPVRVIRGTDFARIREGDYTSIPRRHESIRRVERRQLQSGDVVMEISGGSQTSGQSTGRTLFLSDDNLMDLQDIAIPASFCRLVRFNEEHVESKYAYYCLQEMYMSGRVKLYENQSTGISNFQFEHFLDSEILSVPPLGSQRSVVHVLETMDDRILLNLRIGETLEEMAQALFRSWFVAFDPVRARAEGRELSLPVHMADLFPHRFSNSELGLIPESWTVEPLSKIADHLRETEHPGDSPSTSFSHHSIPAYDSGMVPVEQYGSSIKSHKAIVKPGAVLISRLNPEIERVWLPYVSNGERAVCSTEFMVLMPRQPFTSSYLYCLARSKTFRHNVMSLVTGTSKSHQRAPAKSVMSIGVPVPPAEIVAAFDEYAKSILDRAQVHRAEASLLGLLRDVLLPRLVSGSAQSNVNVQ